MNTIKKRLMHEIAVVLSGYGYDVYLSRSSDQGFYTDGNRIVTFRQNWNSTFDFSGNYVSESPLIRGTQWTIAIDVDMPTREQADRFIRTNAPQRIVGMDHFTYTTKERQLSRYGKATHYSNGVKTESPDSSPVKTVNMSRSFITKGRLV